MADKYPIYKKALYTALIVKFSSECQGTVVVGDKNFKKGDSENDWFSCNNTGSWKDIDNSEVEELSSVKQ